jgi:hypothetical protein
VLGFFLNVPLGQSEAKDKELVRNLIPANAKMVRLDVSMNELPIMDVLNS